MDKLIQILKRQRLPIYQSTCVKKLGSQGGGITRLGTWVLLLALTACGGDVKDGEEPPTVPGKKPHDPNILAPDSYHLGYRVNKPLDVSDDELKAVPQTLEHKVGKPQKGEYTVDSAGRLRYTYKIEVPPAVGGDGPEIGVAYASASAVGDMETGWNLTGIGAITKCPATKAKDGFIGNLRALASDQNRFCLDGKPLVLVSGSSYGEDGSEYVTEILSDIRVKAIGRTSFGPEYFESKTGDGKTIVYGSQIGTRILDFRDNSIHGWLQDAMIDGNGNVTSYEYNDKHKIEFIWYQGKTVSEKTVRIHFKWESISVFAQAWETPDPSVYSGIFSSTEVGALSVSNGVALLTASGRLTSISTSVAATNVAEYEFEYEPLKSRGQGPTNNLKSIRYCGADVTLCSEPIVFSWEYKDENTNSSDSCDYSYANVDTDLIGGMPAFSNMYKKSVPLTDNFGWGNANYYSQVLGDFNNDDLIDVGVVYTFSDGNTSKMTARFALNLGDGTFSSYGNLYSATLGGLILNQRLAGDLNNDGYDDLIVSNSGESGWNIYSILNNGNGSFSAPKHFKVSDGNFIDDRSFKKITGDFNGDGFLDIMAFNIGHGNTVNDPLFNKVSGLVAHVALGNGDGSFRQAKGGKLANSSDFSKSLKTDRALFTGDFNADGITDIASVYINDSSTAFSPDFAIDTVVAFGTESGLFRDPIIEITTVPKGRKYTKDTSKSFASVADINGDGVSDILIHLQAGPTKLISFISRGDGTFLRREYSNVSSYDFTHPDNHPYGDCNVSNTQAIAADFNGDGFVDVSYGTDQFYMGMGNGKFLRQGGMRIKSSDDVSGTGGGLTVHGSLGIGDTTYGAYAFDVNRDSNPDAVEVVVDRNGLTVGTLAYSPNVNQQYMTKIEEGLGRTVEINYKPIDSGEIYTRGSSKTYPLADLGTGKTVVSRVTLSNPSGGAHTLDYHYYDLVANLEEKRVLGFARISEIDSRNGATKNRFLKQDYPLSGSVYREEIRLENGILVQETETDYVAEVIERVTGGQVHRHNKILIGGVSNHSYNHDGSLIASLKETYSEFDEFGRPWRSESIRGDGYSTVIEKLIDNSTSWSDYYAGRLRHKTEVRTGSELNDQIINEQSYDYYPSGLIKQVVIEPNKPDQYLAVNFQYDGYGQLTRKETLGSPAAKHPVAPRVETYDITLAGGRQYSSAGAREFITVVTNGEGHITKMHQDRRSGAPTKEVDANGLVTSYKYFGIGDLVSKTHPDGTVTLHVRDLCGVNCPKGAVYQVYVKSTGTPFVETYFGRDGQELRRRTVGLNGEIIYQDTVYDEFGQETIKTEPFFLGESNIKVSMHEYDDLKRKLLSVNPNDGKTIFTYSALNGRGIKATRNQVRFGINGQDSLMNIQEQNPDGSPTSVVNPYGAEAQYKYDAFNRLSEIIDPNGNKTKFVRDQLGRVTGVSDPDTGIIEIEVDAHGLERYRKDNSSNEVVSEYDRLGRLTSRRTREGLNMWVYDQFPYSIGRLTQEIASSGAQKIIQYDTFGRVRSETQSTGAQEFTLINSYEKGRLTGIEFPTGLTISYGYNLYDHLKTVSSSEATYWEASGLYANGDVKSESFGNGMISTYRKNPYSGRLTGITTSLSGTSMMAVQDLSFGFDTIGNLDWRADHFRGNEERFEYDLANRLEKAFLNDGLNAQHSYDDIGNLRSKTDFGVDYKYGENGAGPTAVSSIVTTSGTNFTYRYDDNGNMISGGGRSIEYTSFNKPRAVIGGGSAVSFLYDANQMRVSMAAGTATTYYVNPAWGNRVSYEKIVGPGGVEHRHYINALGGPVAIHVTRDGSTDENIKYIHKDHLGSVSAITGDLGQIVEETSFHAFGKRRNANWIDVSRPSEAASTTRGFTGHEHLDGTGLINMNARLYDPSIGRFLSPDTIIPSLTNIEALNRYTYVYNNPLSLTDPSGHSPLGEGVEARVERMRIRMLDGETRGAEGGAAASNYNATNHNATADGGLSEATDSPNASKSVDKIAADNESNPTTAVQFAKPGIEGVNKKQPPDAPKGVDIDKNIEQAKSSYNPFWFRSQVQNRGPWDYKQLGKQYGSFGNFHYGATGAAFGFPKSVLLNEAGRAAIRDHTSSPEFGVPGPSLAPWLGTGSHGDDPVDAFWVKQGIDYLKSPNQWVTPEQK